MHAVNDDNNGDVLVKVVGRAGGDRDVWRCRSGARGRLQAVRAMARPEERVPAADGADMAAGRETSFRVRPLLDLSKMEAA